MSVRGNRLPRCPVRRAWITVPLHFAFNVKEIVVTTVGRGVSQTEDDSRIFVAPDLSRYERKGGGEVIVVEPTDDAQPSGGEDD